MPTWLNPVVHLVQSLIIAGGVIALMVTGKMAIDVGVGILTGQTGLWAGIGGTALLSSKSVAAPEPISGGGTTTVPPVPAGGP